MFTDLVNSTKLKNTLGAAVYADLIKRHDEIFRTALEGIESAQVLQDTGDGYFASFDTASAAVRAALRFAWLMKHEAWPAPFASRIGIHLGEVAQFENAATGEDRFVGIAADLAARVMSLGQGGQILLTKIAFNEARQFVTEHPPIPGQNGDRPAIKWVAHGPYLFKGAEEPMDVFEVGAEGVAPLTPPPDSEKARRHIRPGDDQTLGWRPAVNLTLPNSPAWVLREKLGEGGFGEVWLAEHAKSQARRVFKFCFDAQRLRALKREVALFRLLSQTLGERRDIARVVDWQFETNPYFIELEHAPAGNLVQWAAEKGGIDKVPLERRLSIVAQVAHALAAAHSIGILHKDVKPSNVLMDRESDGEEHPRLTDFGIGALVDQSRLHQLGITAGGFTASDLGNVSSGGGTQVYTPPEVLSGKPHTVQGDIYALGILLYQVAVGDLSRPLADGWRDEIADPLLRDDIAHCVDGDPKDRFASATTLARQLETLAQRREQWESEQRAARRRRRVRTFLTVAAIVLLVGGVTTGFLLKWQQSRKQAIALEQQRRHRLGLDYSPPVQLASVAAFVPGQHPEFGLPPGGQDPTVLKFDHAKHVDRLKDRFGEMNDRCRSCHNYGQAPLPPRLAGAPAAATAEASTRPTVQNYSTDHRYMQRVNFQSHCAACHSLEMKRELAVPPAMRRKLQELPHGNPQLVRNKLMASFPKSRFDEKLLLEMIADVHGQCALCHEVTSKPPAPGTLPRGGGATPARENLAQTWLELTETGIPQSSQRRWFPRAEFNHEAHDRLDCTRCHTNAASSARASDLLLPGLAGCVQCHKPEGGTAPAACQTCHNVR